MLTYKIVTLGCKVNQYETQALETFLEQRGCVRTEGLADVVIVNTCAVTAESGRKSRQAIRHLAKENPGARIAVCGCFSQLEPERLADLGCDIVYGTGNHEQLADAIVEGRKESFTDNPFQRRIIEDLPAGAVDGRTRAMMKIQDGCDNFCTYCVIPFTRGRVRSLPMEEAAEQARGLETAGFREIVLTGIEIASYGKDLPGKPGLADVIQAISAAAPGCRLHLGSLEPTAVTEEFCQKLAACGNVCRHFHLSLQSGCDKTLKAMNRKYDSAFFRERCELLRSYFPLCSLTADMIAGFPGETEADFARSLDFIRECGLSFVHCFPYSERPGTKAASMPDRWPRAEKEGRVRQAAPVVAELRRQYAESCVGACLRVLFETETSGHADNYEPVTVDTPQERGTVKNVQIRGFDGESLVGFVV